MQLIKRILDAANRAEMADVEQMKKIVPLVTCEITFGQNVCELMFGITYIESEFENQDQSCQTANPKQLCGFLTHVSLWDFGL